MIVGGGASYFKIEKVDKFPINKGYYARKTILQLLKRVMIVRSSIFSVYSSLKYLYF